MTQRPPNGRALTAAYAASLLVGIGIVAASASGLASGVDAPYGDSSLVLVSRGADAANLVFVLPILLGPMWLAQRGSLTGLLLWPGALFYTLYAYVPYLIGAPFSGLFFVHVALVTISAFTVIGLVATIDAETVRRRWAAAPARAMGAALVVIAIAAYVGLTITAIGAFGDPAGEAATRPLAVADWALGTPVLLVGGALLWRRLPLGYVAAPGLFLVSGLGGVVFVAAAAVDNLGSGPQTEAAVTAVHLVISLVSLALLAFFLARARPSAPRFDDRR
ncbi:MAG: hypothetical protein EPO16_09510 [Dehalococcoidia bacterium]|nr:MAG: hypothetical protein EPO16_09510 [Dehalococcoidia bacterium]